MAREFDVIVIGGGPAGEVCAGRLGEGGLSVALVEEHLVGGECSYYACMPSKALLRPAQALAEVRRIPGAAQAVTGVLDAEAALKRRDEVVHDLDDASQVPWLTDRGVTLVRGHGALSGERTVTVGAEELSARRAIVLATGTEPLLPPIDGLDAAEPWTNRQGTTAHQVPGRLLVLGGGVAGVELAQAWATLGASVAVVELAPRLLVREEPFAGELVHQALLAQGVEVHLGVRAVSVTRNEGGVELGLEDGTRLEGDEILVAVGRRLRTHDLGLESVGLEPGKPLQVDTTLRPDGHPWLYAIGDVNGRALLTHMGKYQARLVADTILGQEAAISGSAQDLGSPRVVFTEPQVAAVGHTLESGQQAGIAVRAADASIAAVAGASFVARDAAGQARIVVDQDRGVLVGATFVGAEVAELLHAATIAVVGEVPLERLWHAVPAFPTRSEIWLRLLEEYGL